MKNLFASLAVLALGTSHAPIDDREAIEKTITTLAQGIDAQDGASIAEALRADAAVFATNPTNDGIIHVTGEMFAELHASKRFGGERRTLAIETIDITDSLVASAKAVAANDEVHYTYYFGLVKLDGQWQIQTLVQRSRLGEAGHF